MESGRRGASGRILAPCAALGALTWAQLAAAQPGPEWRVDVPAERVPMEFANAVFDGAQGDFWIVSGPHARTNWLRFDREGQRRASGTIAMGLDHADRGSDGSLWIAGRHADSQDPAVVRVAPAGELSFAARVGGSAVHALSVVPGGAVYQSARSFPAESRIGLLRVEGTAPPSFSSVESAPCGLATASAATVVVRCIGDALVGRAAGTGAERWRRTGISELSARGDVLLAWRAEAGRITIERIDIETGARIWENTIDESLVLTVEILDADHYLAFGRQPNGEGGTSVFGGDARQGTVRWRRAFFFDTPPSSSGESLHVQPGSDLYLHRIIPQPPDAQGRAMDRWALTRISRTTGLDVAHYESGPELRTFWRVHPFGGGAVVWRRDGAPSRFRLVRLDGSVVALDTTLEAPLVASLVDLGPNREIVAGGLQSGEEGDVIVVSRRDTTTGALLWSRRIEPDGLLIAAVPSLRVEGDLVLLSYNTGEGISSPGGFGSAFVHVLELGNGSTRYVLQGLGEPDRLSYSYHQLTVDPEGRSLFLRETRNQAGDVGEPDTSESRLLQFDLRTGEPRGSVALIPTTVENDGRRFPHLLSAAGAPDRVYTALRVSDLQPIWATTLQDFASSGVALGVAEGGDLLVTHQSASGGGVWLRRLAANDGRIVHGLRVAPGHERLTARALTGGPGASIGLTAVSNARGQSGEVLAFDGSALRWRTRLQNAPAGSGWAPSLVRFVGNDVVTLVRDTPATSLGVRSRMVSLSADRGEPRFYRGGLFNLRTDFGPQSIGDLFARIDADVLRWVRRVDAGRAGVLELRRSRVDPPNTGNVSVTYSVTPPDPADPTRFGYRIDARYEGEANEQSLVLRTGSNVDLVHEPAACAIVGHGQCGAQRRLGELQQEIVLARGSRATVTGHARLLFPTLLPRPIVFSADADAGFDFGDRDPTDDAAAAAYRGLTSIGAKIEAGHSGSWFDPARSGEGWILQILENGRALLYWFSYPNSGDPGDQRWFIAQNGRLEGETIRFDEVYETSGTRFGAGFDAAQVVRADWGTLTLTFAGCDRAQVTYAGLGAYGAATRDLVRLTALDGLPCASTAAPSPRALHSGSWFDPARSGEGWIIETLPDSRAVVYWFTYGPSGNLEWMIGTGTATDSAVTVDLLRPVGTRFGSAFDANQVQRPAWGGLTFTRTGCNSGTVSYNGLDPAYGSATRTVTRLATLSGLRCEG